MSRIHFSYPLACSYGPTIYHLRWDQLIWQWACWWLASFCMSLMFVKSDLQRCDQRPTTNVISVFLSLPTYIIWMCSVVPFKADRMEVWQIWIIICKISAETSRSCSWRKNCTRDMFINRHRDMVFYNKRSGWDCKEKHTHKILVLKAHGAL